MSLKYSKRIFYRKMISRVKMNNNQLQQHRTRSQHPHIQIQMKRRANKNITYHREKDELQRSSPTTNSGLQHATVQ
ncbi:unnamed protein product [Merluccius merluccius]